MSYDLFLKPKSGELSAEQFKIYFKHRENYEIFIEPNSLQARYVNKITGANFYFEYQQSLQHDEDEHYPIAFNIGYLKPSYFSKEANFELKELVGTHNLMVNDPQINGMGVGDYQSDKFINAWLRGNSLVCESSFLSNKEIPTLLSEKVENVWLWNKNKNQLQDNISNDVFIPSVMYFRKDGKVLTACVWEDGIPIIIPPVDMVVIVRKNLAPKKGAERIEDITFVMWDELKPILEDVKLRMEGDAYHLFYKMMPYLIRKFIVSLDEKDMSELQRIPPEFVLDMN